MHDVGRGSAADLDALVELLLAHPVFRQVLVDSSEGAVLDVAGGSGLLSRLLANRGVSGLVVVDPKALLPVECDDDEPDFDVATSRFRAPRERGDRWWHGGSGKTACGSPLGDVLDGARCVLGFRPCAATAAIARFARERRVPFALVPCCAVSPWPSLPAMLVGLRREGGASVTLGRLPSGARTVFAAGWDEGAAGRRRRPPPPAVSAAYRLG